jgi:hypothetical protein
MANEVKLLSGDEIATLRERTDRSNTQWDQHFKYRVCATLEALAALAHERLDALIDAQAERDAARMELATREADLREAVTALDRVTDLFASGQLEEGEEWFAIDRTLGKFRHWLPAEKLATEAELAAWVKTRVASYAEEG